MKTLLAVLMLIVGLAATAQTSTTTSLVSDKQIGPLGTVFTLTATVTDAQGPVKLGQVTFYDGDPAGPASELGTVVLNQANGTATLKRAFMIGSHAITAKFLGTNTEAASSSSSPTITVTGQYASTTTLFTEESGSSQKLVARVSGQGLIPITGSVTFTDTTTNTVLGTAPLNTTLLRTGFQQTSAIRPPSPGISASTVSAAGDFNGDGMLDLMVVTLIVDNPDSNSIQLYLGNGDGTFRAAGTISLPALNASSVGCSIATADVNGDGKLDLLVAVSSGGARGSLYSFLGHGDGMFATPQTASLGFAPVSIAVDDFNGDGKVDVAVLNSRGESDQQFNGDVGILLGHGNGTFGSQQTSPVTGGSQIVAGDFNGDGKTDLAIAIGVQIILRLGHGNGTFESDIFTPTANNAVTLASGDFNGDGKLDLAVAGTALQILLGHGNGTFESLPVTKPVPAAKYISVADFNHDGKLDIVIGDATRNLMAALLGHGTGTFLAEPAFSLPPISTGKVLVGTLTGDFSADGVPGLAVNVSSTFPGVFPYIAVLRDFNPSASTAAAGLTGFTLTGGGSHTIKATYSGDEHFIGSAGTGSVQQ